MEGKLIKNDGTYCLTIGHERVGDLIIATDDKDLNKMLNYPCNLSLKNCQAIENDYDLDELAWKEFPYNEWEYSNGTFGDINEENRETFKIGFQKAVEILGDKKFAKEDMLRVGIHCWNIASRPTYGATYNVNEIVENYIQSLQQNEWLIEIEMEEVSEEYKDGTIKVVTIPKLDENGCLILKRK